MFERFSDGARRLVVSAAKVTAAVGDDSVGAEHLLWAAFEAEPGNPAVRALLEAGVSEERVLPGARAASQAVPQAPRLPFRPDGKAATNRTVVEAMALGVDRVGVEHFVLALLGGETGRGVIRESGADPDEVRSQIRSAL